MFFKSQRDDLDIANRNASNLLSKMGNGPTLLSPQNISTFWGELGYACRLIYQEKEIIFFALLQWLVIALAYVLWTQMLDWIPDSLWEAARDANERDRDGGFGLINLVLLAWSFLVISVVCYPISLLNAAMVAAHYLRSSHQTSTIAKCLNLASGNLGRLWIFTTIDAWITVNAILDRLPKRRGKRRTVADEVSYYAWKIGTMGVLPALVAGKSFVGAAKDSFSLLKNSPLRTIGIRMGYSLICWVIGIATYVGSFYFFYAFGDRGDTVNKIYNFYSLMAVPIVVAVGATGVLVRPFFLVMVSKLYTDIVPMEPPATGPASSKALDELALFFAILLCTLLVLYFFGDQLGIRDWIERLSDEDVRRYLELLRAEKQAAP